MTSLDPTNVSLLISDDLMYEMNEVVYERQSSQAHARATVHTYYIPSK